MNLSKLLFFFKSSFLLFIIVGFEFDSGIQKKTEFQIVQKPTSDLLGVWINEAFDTTLKKNGSINLANKITKYHLLYIDSIEDSENTFTVQKEIYGVVNPENIDIYRKITANKLVYSHSNDAEQDTCLRNCIIIELCMSTPKPMLKIKTYHAGTYTYWAENFVKIAENDQYSGQYIPISYLNNSIIAGNYLAFNSNQKIISQEIQFKNNGNLVGMPIFTNYKLEQYYDQMWENIGYDVIELQTPGFENGMESPTYGALVKQNNLIKIYEIEYSDVVKKQIYTPKKLLFTLVPKY